MQKRFFTLIELIFICAAVVLLLSMASTLVSDEQYKAMSVHCLSNLKAGAAGMAAYAADNKGYYLLYKYEPETYKKKRSHVTWGFWMTWQNNAFRS